MSDNSYFDSLAPRITREALERHVARFEVPPHPSQQGSGKRPTQPHLGQVPMPLPENIYGTYSWKCPTCSEWEHGYSTTALAAQGLFEHEDERHA